MNEVRPNSLLRAAPGDQLNVEVLAGSGPALIEQAAQISGTDGSTVLRTIAGTLLVNKGLDWTLPILGDYLGLYEDSAGTFVLAWDRASAEFIAHGAIFQSARFPAVGLVAHIRTHERFRGRGLGSLVVERVVQAGFEKGAQVIVLATDDKLHRLHEGEKAANRLYSKIGFAVIAENRLADTVDWLMAINREIFDENLSYKENHDGHLPDTDSETVARSKQAAVDSIRRRLTQPSGYQMQNVGHGDLAALFLLFNVCPPNDFKVKLSAWGIHIGPELERQFVVNIRPALADRDRLEDASMVLRDGSGCIQAVCAATQETPFTRQTFRMDFYCLPALLRTSSDVIRELIERAILRIVTCAAAPRPARLAFWGADESKVEMFKSLGFVPTANVLFYNAPGGGTAELREHVRTLHAT